MKPNIPLKFNFTYRVLCNVTGKYYLGVHSTNKLEDGYLGTGKIIKLSLKKYGRHAHIREILSHFSTREEATEAERQLITESTLLDPMCMNLQTGGDCNIKFSASTLMRLKKTPEQRAKISAQRRGKATFVTPEARARQGIMVSGSKNGMFGRERTPIWKAEHSAKMKILMLGKNLGKPNLFARGAAWYHDPVMGQNHMVKGEPPAAWVKGRIRATSI